MKKIKDYKGYGYHGGGRPATGIKRKGLQISATEEQILKIKKLAKEKNQTVSKFILDAIL